MQAASWPAGAAAVGGGVARAAPPPRPTPSQDEPHGSARIPSLLRCVALLGPMFAVMFVEPSFTVDRVFLLSVTVPWSRQTHHSHPQDQE